MLSKQLKLLRNTANMSQKDLSKKLFVSQQAIAKWENGSSTPNPETLVKIAGIFKVSTDELLGNTEKNLPSGTGADSTEVSSKVLFMTEKNLSSEEMRLLSLYRELNEEGQDKLISYASDLSDTGNYKKNNPICLANRQT